MSCAERQVTILTTHRVIEVNDDRQLKITTLKHDLSPKKRWSSLVSIVILNQSNRVLVGKDKGEFGGGLWSIDKATGAMTEVARNDSGDICGGPLNTGCDPINGLAAMPWKPGCVAVAIGLEHLSFHGRLVEICADKIRRLYFKPMKEQQARIQKFDGDEPMDTVPFFGLAQRDDKLWASAVDGIYRIDASGVAMAAPLPKFSKVGPFNFSFDLEGFVLVLTEINAHASLSGSVPMLLPR